MQQVQRPRRTINISMRIQMIIVFSLLYTLVFAGLFYWLRDYVTTLALDNVKRELVNIAESTAAGIDGDAHQALYDSRDIADMSRADTITDERYWAVVNWFVTVRNTQGRITDSEGNQRSRVVFYTYVATGKAGEVEFVASSAAAVDPSLGAAFREAYKPQSQAMLGGLEQTTVNLDNAVSDQWGTWYSAFAPIRNSDGEIVGAVGVDMADTTVLLIRQQVERAVVPAFLITYTIILIGLYVVSNRLTRPIIALTAAAQKVAEGDYRTEVLPTLDRRLTDETTTLNRVFGLMVEKVGQRETELKQQVQELQIIIDTSKRDAQVTEIVDSEFFTDLATKAKGLRARTPREQNPPPDTTSN
jgi:methyl-accepting chemotaxis protein